MDEPSAEDGEPAAFGISLAVVHHAFLHASEAAFADIPGAARGYLVLGVCSHQAPPTQAACAYQLGIDRTVFTYLVDELERDMLVRRTPDPNDRRARRISITAKGTRLLERTNERLVETESHTLRGLEPADRDTLRLLLWRAAVASTPDDSTAAGLATQLARTDSRRSLQDRRAASK